MKPSLLLYTNSELLEGPIFDLEFKQLYFVSILEGLVYMYDPKTKELLSIKLDSPTSCVYLINKKVVLVASKNGFFELNFETLEKNFKFQIEIADNLRFNDGIKDPKGRIIIGTMGFPEINKNSGTVFSYYNGKSKPIIKHTTISNGLAFTDDHKTLYFIDTPTKKVAKYHYDLNSGNVTFDAYVIEFKGLGSPDGMCIDKNGYLWIAEWGGSCISQWNPQNGTKLKEIILPCSNVTSCCFDDHFNLYITTAKSDSNDDILGGGLFYVNLNTHNIL